MTNLVGGMLCWVENKAIQTCQRRSVRFGCVFMVLSLFVMMDAPAMQPTQCGVSPREAYEQLVKQEKQVRTRRQRMLININTASVAELIQLPKIGVKKAQAIVLYRTRFGSFSSVDELVKVKGIGKKTVEGFRHRITIM